MRAFNTLTVSVKEDVGRLEVAVQHLLLVDEGQRFQRLHRVAPDRPLREVAADGEGRTPWPCP